MTTHVIDDEKFTDFFAEIRDAYRVGEGNQTLQDMCEVQVREPVVKNVAEWVV